MAPAIPNPPHPASIVVAATIAFAFSDLTARDKGRYCCLTSWLDYRIDAG